MEHQNLDFGVANPAIAAMSYGGIIRQTKSPREIEYLVFVQVTASMQLAEQTGATAGARIEAAHRNRELWQSLACDLASEDNVLPDQLRASLLGLAIWVTNETARVIRTGASLIDLIAVNRTIMKGLRPHASETDSNEIDPSETD